MATNTYTYGSLGERWTIGEPTSKDRLDLARNKADANRWSLLQLLADPDDTTAFALPSGLVDLSTLTPATIIDRVSYVSSAIDAHKIIPFFLDEPAHVSPSFNWQKAIRQKSWYAELGAPPTHGAFVIDASQNAISWIDLDSATLAIYMTFTVGANNVLYSTSSNLSSIAAKDFKILVGATQMTLIDLLEDRSLIYTTGGIYQSIDDIENRDTGSGIQVISTAASYSIYNSTVNSVAICRDPNGGTDQFGRPLHYWMAGQATKASIYNPITNAIYDSAAGTVPLKSVDIAPSGYYVVVTDDTYDYTRIGLLPVDAISADGFGETALTVGTIGGALWSLGFPSDPAGTTFNKIVDGGILGGPLVLGGSSQGAFIVHYPPVVNSGEHGIIKLTSTYATPLMKGTRVAAYPLDSVTDRSGNSHTLTNNNTVVFTGTGPFGANTAAVFDGVNQSLAVVDHADFGDGTETEITVSCYAYLDTIAGGEDTIISKYNSGSSSNRSFALQTNNGALFFVINNSTTSYTASGITLAAGQWYHLCGTYDGATVKLYVDGIIAPTTAAATGAIPDTSGEFRIGSENSNDHYFDGMISQVSVSFSAWTEDEIRLEYQRMQAGLAGNTTLLTADDVDSIQIAPSGEYAIVTAGDVAHVMDPKTGIILSTDAIGAGTLNDAAIWQKDGADTPSYLLGASTTVEAVQVDERIGG